jgi:hypothetical protein
MHFPQRALKLFSAMMFAVLIAEVLNLSCNSSVLGSSLSHPPIAHAAQVSSNPLVLVAVDKTQSSSCTEIFQANIGTPQAATKQISCAPGTIMADVTMLRSQAIAQHEAYVVIPSPQDSAAIHQQYTKQIQALHASKQATLQSQMSTYAPLVTRCGQTGSISLTWDLFEGTLNASISFYKSTDCTTVFFQDSQLNTTVATYYALIWSMDIYAGNSYSVPSSPNVQSIGHRFHLVGSSAPTGYYYENYLYPYPSNLYGPEWDNIGPIN